jgi:hypothetical protein
MMSLRVGILLVLLVQAEVRRGYICIKVYRHCVIGGGGIFGYSGYGQIRLLALDKYMYKDRACTETVRAGGQVPQRGNHAIMARNNYPTTTHHTGPLSPSPPCHLSQATRSVGDALMWNDGGRDCCSLDWYPVDSTRPLLLDVWHSEHGEWSQ